VAAEADYNEIDCAAASSMMAAEVAAVSHSCRMHLAAVAVAVVVAAVACHTSDSAAMAGVEAVA
jgi:hypothetical protein